MYVRTLFELSKGQKALAENDATLPVTVPANAKLEKLPHSVPVTPSVPDRFVPDWVIYAEVPPPPPYELVHVPCQFPVKSSALATPFPKSTVTERR